MATVMDTPLDTLEQIRNDLHEVYLSGRANSLDYRTYQLKQLAFLIKDNDAAIKAAMKEDLGRSDWEVEQAEIMPSLNEIGLAVKKLPQWIKDEGGLMDAVWGMKGLNPRVKKQPKGVALIISPWNFPFNLSFGVLTGAISAGCPAVVKPSELAPACSALLAKLLPLYLDSEAYKVVLGGVEHSTKLLELDWGHICFTGSSKVGRIAAEAAAKRLVPITLELSGKNPVFISPCADFDISARRIVSMKGLGCGQACVAPDYIMCPQSSVDRFTQSLTKALEEQYPASTPLSALKGDHYSPLHSQGAYDRIVAQLDIAEKEGRLIVKGERSPGNGKQGGRIGISVVMFKDGLKTTDTGVRELLEDESFGPVLVVVPVKDLEEGINHVQRQPNPLALYVFSSSKKVFNHVIENTLSGGAIWNDCNMTPIARSLPFGGVGHSGTGQYHGKNGFETFSHRRALLDVPFYLESLMSLRYPPVSSFRKAILRMTISEPISFPRPESVEHEGRARRRRKLLKSIAYLAVVVLVASVTRSWTGLSLPWTR